MCELDELFGEVGARELAGGRLDDGFDLLAEIWVGKSAVQENKTLAELVDEEALKALVRAALTLSESKAKR